MEFAILSKQGVYLLLKWSHYIFGIAWIGMLWYFNFVQGPFFAETDANTKTAATQKLVPRALWYFRWGAAFTVLSGLLLIGLKYHINAQGLGFGEWMTNDAWFIRIFPGILMGLVMASNVWFVIWPRQQKVIAAANGEKVENLPVLARRAFLASRTNTLLSLALLFFMGAGANLPGQIHTANVGIWYLVLFVIVGLIEVNALVATNGITTKPIEKPVGVIHMGLVLAVVLYILLVVIL